MKAWVNVINGVLIKEKSNTAPFSTGSIYGEEIFVSLLTEVYKHLPNFHKEKKLHLKKF